MRPEPITPILRLGAAQAGDRAGDSASSEAPNKPRRVRFMAISFKFRGHNIYLPDWVGHQGKITGLAAKLDFRLWNSHAGLQGAAQHMGDLFRVAQGNHAAQFIVEKNMSRHITGCAPYR